MNGIEALDGVANRKTKDRGRETMSSSSLVSIALIGREF